MAQAGQRDKLSCIQAPVLILTGRRDMIRPRHSLWMGEQIPDSKVVFVKGADHFTLQERKGIRGPYHGLAQATGTLKETGLFPLGAQKSTISAALGGQPPRVLAKQEVHWPTPMAPSCPFVALADA